MISNESLTSLFTLNASIIMHIFFAALRHKQVFYFLFLNISQIWKCLTFFTAIEPSLFSSLLFSLLTSS